MGSKKTKSTKKYSPAGFIEEGAKSALGKAQQWADTPYSAYQGDRVAGLSPNEQMAADLAAEGAGDYAAPLAEARQRFSEADISAYMNPYTDQVINPALNDLAKQQASRRNQQAGALSSAGAYGSRAALQLAESDSLADQDAARMAGDLRYKSFEGAADRWQSDQNRILASIGVEQRAKMGDYQRLMGTGEVQRYVEQAQKDFDYQQFVEERDWGGKQAALLTDVLQGLKGSYSTKQTSKSKQKAGLSDYVGAAVAIGGGIFSMGGSTALASMGTAVGGTTVSDIWNSPIDPTSLGTIGGSAGSFTGSLGG